MASPNMASPTSDDSAFAVTLADEGEAQNVRVFTRVRLFNSKEIDSSKSKKELLRSVVKMRGKTCVVMENYTDAKGFPAERERQAFDFDECFWSIPPEQNIPTTMPFATQKYVYEHTGQLALNWALGGFNVCLFAYGQTGSGKTYSMLGIDSDPGISPRMVDELFDRINQPGVRTIIKCNFFEIYNEQVQDLFNKKASTKPDFKAPKIRQHPTKGVYVEGLEGKVVTTAAQTKRYIERGTNERASAETKMNAHSSRSHAIFQIHVDQQDVLNGIQRQSTINLIDLAGSEKAKQSQAAGDRLKEATNINASLTTLRRVIDVLIENSKIKNPKNWKHAPYRESVLTYVLSDSLGGNSKTMMIATISPHEDNIEDTVNTLQYALRAKSIVCHAKANEEQSRAVVDSMRDEILKLREQMSKPQEGGVVVNSAEAEEQIAALDTQIRLYEKNKQEVEEELRKQKETQEAMQTQIVAEKSERFAAAFRNAFLIQTQKKQQKDTEAELDDLKRRNRALQEELTHFKNEIASRDADLQSLKDSSEAAMARLKAEAANKDLTLKNITRQLVVKTEENHGYKSREETLTKNNKNLAATKEEQERQIARLQEEVTSLGTAAQLAAAQKERTAKAHADEIAQLREEIENLRRRKDKYKLSAMENKAKADVVGGVVDALRGDRQTFLQTIKAQQVVVEEQSAVVKRYADDRRDEERKTATLERQVSTKNDDLRVMSEALREMQNASTEFLYENHSIHREMERLKKQNDELRGTYDSVSPARRQFNTSGNISYGTNNAANTSLLSGSTAFSPLSKTSMSPIRSTPRRYADPAVY